MSKFNHVIKTGVFILGLTIFALAPAAQALAEQRQQNYRYHYGHDDDDHNYNRRPNWRDNYRDNHRQRHNWRDHYSYNYNYNNNHNDEVMLGILAGGLLFSAMAVNQRGHETVYVPQQRVYVQPPQQQWTQKQPVLFQDSSCLQTREYQTNITVGGQTVPAYGQSCLQPDGTWKLGAARPEPNFRTK